MKSLLFLLVAALAPLAHAALPAPSTFTIRGHVTNFPDSTTVRLVEEKGDLLKTIATDTVTGGHFTFTDTISSGPRNLMILSGNRNSPGTWLNVWVAPGAEISVTGDGLLHPLWDVEGVPEQEYENMKVEALMPEIREDLRLGAQEHALIMKLYMDHKGDREKSSEIWPQIDSLRTLQEPLRKAMKYKELAFIEEMPVSKPWLRDYFSFVKFHGKDTVDTTVPQRLKNLYHRLPADYAASDEGKAIKSWLNPDPVLKIGDMMVDADLYDTDGNLHHLAEHAGRYILLDFWSRGCGPCVQSVPEMEEVISLYADSLSVVGVSVDQEAEWKNFVAEKKLGGSQWNEFVIVGTGLQARYGVKGIPHYVLIDPEGKIIDIWSGYGEGSLKGRLSRHLRK